MMGQLNLPIVIYVRIIYKLIFLLILYFFRLTLFLFFREHFLSQTNLGELNIKFQFCRVIINMH